MATRATPSPINPSTSGTRTGWASGMPLGGATADATPGFVGRYQNVAKADLDTLKRGLGAVAGAALATMSFGYGFARQSIFHPIRTALDVKAEVKKTAEAISTSAKSAVQGMEEKLSNAEVAQLSAKIRALPAMNESQKAQVVTALESSMARITAAQTDRAKDGSMFSLPFKYGVATWKTMAAVRSHERLVDVLGKAAKFSEKYGKHYPDKCSGYFSKIVDDMSDGRMSPLEWVRQRARLAAAGVTNKVLLAVDPFRAHSDYTGAGATA